MGLTDIRQWLLSKRGKTWHSPGESESIQHEEAILAEQFIEKIKVIVRQVMNDTGMLESSYKFRVSLQTKDPVVFSVYMEMPINFHTSTKKLTEVERRVSKIALNQWGVVLKKVFWRIDDEPFQYPAVEPVHLTSIIPESIHQSNRSRFSENNNQDLTDKEVALNKLRELYEYEEAKIDPVTQANGFSPTEPFFRNGYR
jgi:hypothetical protein